MTVETNLNGWGANFHKRFGRTETDESLDGGAMLSHGDGMYSYVVYITSDDFADQGTLTLPQGSIPRTVTGTVIEATTMTGTTPTINVGTDTSEGTNFGIEFAGSLAADVVVDGTLTGTWTAPLTADTVVGVALDGTTPAWTAGKVKVVINFELLT